MTVMAAALKGHFEVIALAKMERDIENERCIKVPLKRKYVVGVHHKTTVRAA